MDCISKSGCRMDCDKSKSNVTIEFGSLNNSKNDND